MRSRILKLGAVVYVGFGIACLVVTYADIAHCEGVEVMWAYALTSIIQSMLMRGNPPSPPPPPPPPPGSPPDGDTTGIVTTAWDIGVEFALAIWGGVSLVVYTADCMRQPLQQFVCVSSALQVCFGLFAASIAWGRKKIAAADPKRANLMDEAR